MLGFFAKETQQEGRDGDKLPLTACACRRAKVFGGETWDQVGSLKTPRLHSGFGPVRVLAWLGEMTTLA